MLERRLRDALADLNPGLPASALDDAFRKLTRPEGSTLEARNRAFHRMLVNGVTVEYRDSEGRIRGAQVQVIDFNGPANNDWLAVNQFTVTENRNTRLGTLTSGREWFKAWRTITGETLANHPRTTEPQVMLKGVFEPSRFFQMEQFDFNSFNRGSTQPLLTQTDLKAQLVVSPPRGVLTYFDGLTMILFGSSDSRNRESSTLTAQRDALLPGLVSGELRVPVVANRPYGERSDG